MQGESERKFAAEKVSENEIYRFMVSYYLLQDQSGWSRTQIIVAIEGAAITAAFAKGGGLGTLALLAGTIIIFLIWQIVIRDWKIRDYIETYLNEVHKPFGFEMKPKASPSWQRGSLIYPLIIYSIMILNLAIVFCTIVRHWIPCISCGSFSIGDGHPL